MTDAEILKTLMDELGYNPNSFGNKLGYKSTATIYHVIKSLNTLSDSMIMRILKYFPNVNEDFLRSGEYPILLDRVPVTENYKLGLESIPKTLKNIENLLKKIVEKLE